MSKIIVRCVHCGDTRWYKKINKRRCPSRCTHKWRIVKGTNRPSKQQENIIKSLAFDILVSHIGHPVKFTREQMGIVDKANIKIDLTLKDERKKAVEAFGSEVLKAVGIEKSGDKYFLESLDKKSLALVKLITSIFESG